MKNTLQQFLIDDLKKVEHHVDTIIENIYETGQQENFKKEIEGIECFLSYWSHQAQFKKETDKQKTFVIYWHDNYGRKDLIGTTNNLNTWLVEHNKEREEEYKEKLSDFENNRNN